MSAGRTLQRETNYCACLLLLKNKFIPLSLSHCLNRNLGFTATVAAAYIIYVRSTFTLLEREQNEKRLGIISNRVRTNREV